MTRQPQWEPTAPIPPVFDHIEPQTPAPRSTMPATPPLEPPVGTIKPADDEPQLLAETWNDTRLSPDTLPLDTIKAALRSRYEEAVKTVAALRKERTQLNSDVKVRRLALDTRIKEAVAELAEAKRIANSLTPRKPRTKKAAK